MNKLNKNEKAAYFLSCKNDGFSPTQKEEFDTWINTSAENKLAFEKAQNMQNLYKSLSANIKDELVKEVKEEIKRDSIFRKYRKYALAATILLCISFTIFQTNRYLNFNIPHEFHTTNNLKNIVLPDGSTITLDAKTKASVKYEKEKRVVSLYEGKALFTVAKNKNKPFEIITDKIKIEVLGTSFQVNNEKEKLTVQVKTGIVSINQYNKQNTKELTKLTKGKELSFDKKTNTFILNQIDTNTIASWKDGILDFKDTSIKNAVDEFRKYQDLRIYLNSEVENLTITGAFRKNEFDKFLFAISQIHSLEVKKGKNLDYVFKEKENSK